MTHYTSDQLASFPWIVSSATLRPEDLLPSFWTAVESLAQLAGKPSPIAADTLADLERLGGEDSREDAWNDELACQLIEELADALQDLAPTGFYFGASEGDAACFGFWLCEDWCDAMEHLGLGSDDPSGWASLIAELDADGIEPSTIEDSLCGRADGWSEEQAGAAYAQDLADEIGAWQSDPKWPYNCIDWDSAWQLLVMSDGYRLHDLGGGEWLVFRNV
jgi:hypothetical protein